MQCIGHENGRAKDTDAGVRRVRARKKAKGEDLLHKLPSQPPPPMFYLKSHNLLWVLSDEREGDVCRVSRAGLYRNKSMKKCKEWRAKERDSRIHLSGWDLLVIMRTFVEPEAIGIAQQTMRGVVLFLWDMERMEAAERVAR